MSDKIMLNFRCPTEVLDAIDNLGVQRYPANTKHGCDRQRRPTANKQQQSQQQHHKQNLVRLVKALVNV